MRNKKLLPMLVFAGIVMLSGVLHAQRPRISVGIGIGGPPPVVYATPCPGPGYYWVDPAWNGRVWVGGYWHAPAFGGGVYFGHDHYWNHERFEHRGHWRR